MKLIDILNKNSFAHSDIVELLSIAEPELLEALRLSAYSTLKKYCSEKVFMRGLIEFSNICINDCLYCGIRKSNSNVNRYVLSLDEIIPSAKKCFENGYGSLVLQSGERNDSQFIDNLVVLIKTIKSETTSKELPNGLGITLSVGEQSLENYKRLYDAGAHRFLLRIETSNPNLYSKIHPSEMKFESRLNALKNLAKAGFQVGTGVMIGLPGQTLDDLANDILFFKSFDVDMIGMGPFIPHENTPMFDNVDTKANYLLALKMIAVTRLVLKDVNIASTTALQAINPIGREEGLLYGANVIMPQMTPTDVRKEYQLYDGKPCLDDSIEQCTNCIKFRIESTGRKIAFNEWGDSKHFFNKQEVKDENSN